MSSCLFYSGSGCVRRQLSEEALTDTFEAQCCLPCDIYMIESQKPEYFLYFVERYFTPAELSKCFNL